jgi:hypothetical protein
LAYAKGTDGGGFETKDFRTAAGTDLAVELIAEMPKSYPSKRAYKAAVKEVAVAVSEMLGNTPAVAAQSYIDPAAFSEWTIESGSKSFEKHLAGQHDQSSHGGGRRRKPSTADILSSGKVALNDDRVEDIMDVEEHTAEVRVVQFEDGVTGIFKPVEGEPDGIRNTVPDRTAYLREAAAYEVAKIVGMEDLVPATVVREIDGELGSVQEFIADADSDHGMYDTEDIMDVGDFPDDVVRAAAFDFVIGNTDRHSGNWLIKKNGKVVLIDNGLSFPFKSDATLQNDEWSEGNRLLNMGFFSVASDGGMSVGSKVADAWEGKWPEIERALKKSGLDEQAINLTRGRYNMLMDAGGRQDSFADLSQEYVDTGGGVI